MFLHGGGVGSDYWIFFGIGGRVEDGEERQLRDGVLLIDLDRSADMGGAFGQGFLGQNNRQCERLGLTPAIKGEDVFRFIFAVRAMARRFVNVLINKACLSGISLDTRPEGRRLGGRFLFADQPVPHKMV